MAPPPPVHLDANAISGIMGSVSICCWIVVFSPQIIENFRSGSGEGLSLAFLVIWLAGDVFNVIGATLQEVLPTMLILGVYYTLADIVLILQVLYYRTTAHRLSEHRQGGFDPGHLNPTTPLLSDAGTSHTDDQSSQHHSEDRGQTLSADQNSKNIRQTVRNSLWNTFAVLMVCAAGVFGWYLAGVSRHPSDHGPPPPEDHLYISLWGQVFGVLCAVLYLGSRVPQIVLNYRKRSTDGLSLLFFLFSCLGNVTYVLSIVFAAIAMGPEWRRYILINSTWLLGSAGTLIFCQFFLYGGSGQI